MVLEKNYKRLSFNVRVIVNAGQKAGLLLMSSRVPGLWSLKFGKQTRLILVSDL